MRRVVLTKNWLGGLMLAIVAAAVCAGLGRWQWDRSQSHTGDLQNLVYAFNWWLFAALCLGVWVKALRLELREQAAALAMPDEGALEFEQLDATEPAGSAAAGVSVAALPADRVIGRAGRGRVVAVDPRSAAAQEAENDAELADWNAWLAAMNAAPRR